MKNEPMIYFAYGANLNLDGMNNRCPGNMPLCKAVLKNYRFMFKSVADIEEAVNHSVHGALYEITKEHLRSLDRFEGYPRLYIRKTVPVITKDGREIQAVVYQMTDRNHYSSPCLGYLNIILSGCRQWQLPDEYIQYTISRAKNPQFGEL
jgi:gamma-glutamylcyclotransferase (GGCT)/AIG2-like uncharacterized protein YtfP